MQATWSRPLYITMADVIIKREGTRHPCYISREGRGICKEKAGWEDFGQACCAALALRRRLPGERGAGVLPGTWPPPALLPWRTPPWPPRPWPEGMPSPPPCAFSCATCAGVRSVLVRMSSIKSAACATVERRACVRTHTHTALKNTEAKTRVCVVRV